MGAESSIDLRAGRGAAAGHKQNQAADDETLLPTLAPGSAPSPADGIADLPPSSVPTEPSAADLARARVMGKLVPRVPWWKRPVDCALAALIGVVTLPISLLVALAVKLTSRGPVFFRQERVGLTGRRFRLLKFRTMVHGASEDVHREHVQKAQTEGAALNKLDAERDNRVTPIGRYLRVLCLDELPQLWNVLRGEMSLVGPRPCIPYELATYKPWYLHRLECLPGLTGLWQVSGKNKLNSDQMMRLDIRYARRQSLWLDFTIYLRTPLAILDEVIASLKRWRARRRAAASRRAETPVEPSGAPPPCAISDSV
jgi:lipopolysaccharide/colanic/teichoic acid biosynthesis glycosyltransferase